MDTEDRAKQLSVASREIPGWRWCFAAACVPLVAGLVFLAGHSYNVANDESPWNTGIGALRFRYRAIVESGPDAGPFFDMLGAAGSVNIIAGAVLAAIIARYGLRRGEPWAWYALLFDLAFIGVHDASAAFRFFLHTGQPVFVFPFAFVTLMTIGLLRTRPHLVKA